MPGRETVIVTLCAAGVLGSAALSIAIIVYYLGIASRPHQQPCLGQMPTLSRKRE